jgi:hypothetical protein
VFGASTEKTRQVLQHVANDGVSSPASPDTSEQSNGTPSPEPPCSEPAESAPSPGHGRNGAQAYAGAEKVKVGHATLKPGDRTPEVKIPVRSEQSVL